MKTKLTSVVVLIAVAQVLSGCYYDEVATFEGLPENVSLKNDLQPIFNQSCNTTGCHDAAPAHDPSLVSQNAFNALTLGNYVNTVDPPKSKLYQEIVSGSMPPSGALSINQQKLILAWISEGAKNN
jgi:hypothetical protein